MVGILYLNTLYSRYPDKHGILRLLYLLLYRL